MTKKRTSKTDVSKARPLAHNKRPLGENSLQLLQSTAVNLFNTGNVVSSNAVAYRITLALSPAQLPALDCAGQVDIASEFVGQMAASKMRPLGVVPAVMHGWSP